MTTKWCDYSDLPATQCAHCRGIEPEPEDPDSGMPWRAKYRGRCKRCRGEFAEGEWIRADHDGYAHADLEDCD